VKNRFGRSACGLDGLGNTFTLERVDETRSISDEQRSSTPTGRTGHTHLEPPSKLF
jgi:hypothetical protein